jgi:hypothetical protein
VNPAIGQLSMMEVSNEHEQERQHHRHPDAQGDAQAQRFHLELPEGAE